MTMSQITETVNMEQVVKASATLLKMGQEAYDIKVILRCPRKGEKLYNQTPAQRELQNSLYTEMARMQAKFIAVKLGIELEEQNDGRVFRMTAYPSYMGDLDQESVSSSLLVRSFKFFMNGNLVVEYNNEVTAQKVVEAVLGHPIQEVSA